MTNTIQLEIKGMTCKHCVAAVTDALTTVGGVAEVQVTLEPGAAVVTGSAPADALIDAIRQEGYEATVNRD